MSLRDSILECLGRAGFTTGKTPLLPLGQPLPLVTGWAISPETATIALIAEAAESDWDPDPWRELFFALASLRHELRQGRPPAFGTPIILAVLREKADAQKLQELAEELSRDYLLFTRLELNLLIDNADVDIEVELAPLLPRCRRAIREGSLVGVEALAKLGAELRDQIIATAQALDDPVLTTVAHDEARAIAEEIGGLVEIDRGERPRPDPVRRLELRGLRVFDQAEIELAPFTLLEGQNGTGKSSVIEALEIVWTGSSQRRPTNVSAQEFDRHLKRDGSADWRIIAWRPDTDVPQTITSTIDKRARIGLGRTVYAVDTAGDFAEAAPDERYAGFLRIVGLEVPELAKAAEDLRQTAKRDLNRVLEQIGLPTVPRTDTPALRYVRERLTALPKPDRGPTIAVQAAAERVRAAAEQEALVFELPLLLGQSDDPRFDELGRLAEQAALELATTPDFVRLAREVGSDFDILARRAEEFAANLEVLIARAARRDINQLEAERDQTRDNAGGSLPAEAARSWLYGARALRRSAETLDRLRDSIDEPSWRDRLERFLERSRETLAEVPWDELEAARRSAVVSPVQPRRPATIDVELLAAAGFAEASLHGLPPSLVESLTALRNGVRTLANSQQAIARSILAAPLVRIDGFEADLHAALARFELSRHLQEPVTRAQQRVLDSLFGQSLREVLVELIMALTRFEWYFYPPSIEVAEKAVSVGGMATPLADLDVRMLLNAGERSIITLAWFLALHVLQPKADRRALLLDDPFSRLDSTNEAAAIATLRSLLRLTKPELFVFSCHDAALADSLAEEFAEFNGWPDRRARYRFARTPQGAASVESVPDLEAAADLEGERDRLGFDSATSNKATAV